MSVSTSTEARVMDAPTPGRPSWPFGPTRGHYPDDDRAQDQAQPDQVWPDQEPGHAVIGEMAQLLRDTRGNLVAAGCVLGGIAVGLALEMAAAAWASRSAAVSVIGVGLLGLLVLCWLTAVTLLVLAGRPVLNALSELRWVTGAPLDPRARWLTLPPTGTCPDDWTWIRAHLLVGAARMARHRSQLADTWTYATAACFLVWTVALFLGLLRTRRTRNHTCQNRICLAWPDSSLLELQAAITQLAAI